MILLGLDPILRVVVSAARLDGNMPDIGVSMLGASHLRASDTLALQFTNEEFKTIIEQKGVTLAQFFAAPDRFVLSNDNQVKDRPAIEITIISAHGLSQEGTALVPLNSQVELMVSYVDPDNVNFIENSLVIKLKDRFDFVQLPEDNSLIVLTPTLKSHSFVVQSAFPGVIRIRGKDVDYKCLVKPLTLRFKQ